MEQFLAVVYGLVPSIGIGYLFYRVLKLVLEGDRRERLAHSQWEAEQERLEQQQRREQAAAAPAVSGDVRVGGEPDEGVRGAR